MEAQGGRALRGPAPRVVAGAVPLPPRLVALAIVGVDREAHASRRRDARHGAPARQAVVESPRIPGDPRIAVPVVAEGALRVRLVALVGEGPRVVERGIGEDEGVPVVEDLSGLVLLVETEP